MANYFFFAMTKAQYLMNSGLKTGNDQHVREGNLAVQRQSVRTVFLLLLAKKKKTLAFLERKKKRGSHPPLPSQPHKGRNGQQRSFHFPALSLLTSGEREEEAPVNEARFHPLTPT